MRHILSESGQYRYLLNDLYITDYCLWIQSVSDEVLIRVKEDVSASEINKADVELDVDDWEMEAKLMALKIDDEKSNELDSDDEP